MTEQKSSRRPAFPFVLTGNRLRDGRVVWFDGSAWSASLVEALVARDDDVARRLEAAVDGSAGLVVDPYLVALEEGLGGGAVPAHYRERIRVTGPTYAREGAL